MYKYYNALLNRSGDALAGYYVRVFDASGNPVEIYADESSTPIITESGTAIAAKSDDDGMVRFYVADGEYQLRIFDPNDVFLKAEDGVPMISSLADQLGAAESARDAAIEAKEGTEAAQGAAEAAQGGSEAAEAGAVAAKADAEIATAGAEAAKADAEAARDQAIAAGMAQGIYPVAARDDVPRGATGTGAITGGSGGTDGTFALAFTGGNFDADPSGTFTVSAGAVTAIDITGPGLYIGDSPTAPTLDFSASSGLTSAAASLTVGFLVGSGRYYYTPSLDDGYVSQFQNVGGVATLVSEHMDPLSVGAAAAYADAAALSAAVFDSNAIYSGDFKTADQSDDFWDIQNVFEQGTLDGSGNPSASATTLRMKEAIAVKAGDVFFTDPAGLWTATYCLQDDDGTVIAFPGSFAAKGAPLVVSLDGWLRLIIRQSPAVSTTPADIDRNRPGIRMALSAWYRKLANPALGAQSIPRGALMSEARTITNLPIVLGSVQAGGMLPNNTQNRAITNFLHLGKGSVITTTGGYEFAENFYNLDRTNVSLGGSWRTSLTLTTDALLRISVRKSDNSSLIGVDYAPWLSIDWVQPAIARASTDIAPGIITPEHLSFAVPNPPAAAASYHIVFNVGESHAAGRGETLSSVSVPAGAAYKFVRSSGLLAAMTDPTGNDANALTGKGSWGPALADTIWRASNGGTGVILINSGLGSSRIATSGTLGWAEDGDGWLQAVDDWGDALAQIAALGLPVSGVSVLLSIGSNDAAAGVAKATFKAGVLDLYARLKTLIGAGDNIPINIIQTGPFGDGSSSTGVADVRAAQRELAQENASIFMATDAPIYAAAQDQLLDDDVHYKQELNDIIGRSAAASIVAHGAGIYPAGLD